jgi:uncharacterized protein HemY
MLTAAQARELAGPSLEEKVESLLKTVERLAKEKKRKLRCAYDHKEDDQLWVHGGYAAKRGGEWYKAKEMLEGLGYKVSFFYSDGSFAVDMYTVVEW